MTPEQVKEIAKKISGTTANVYRVAEQVTSAEAGEEVFDLLAKQENLFKCEMCGYWMDMEQAALTDICGPCLDGDNDE